MLEQKLQQLAQSDCYPFHMPGHKRQPFSDFPNPYAIDITEIDGFDNLHHAQGLLREEQELAAELYGSKRSFFLVNGSTCGILAAVSAAFRRGGRILVARNSHKALYHALELRQLVPVYVYPKVTSRGLQGQIRAEDVRRALDEYTDIRAVVITSPTYDGVVSDVAAIAELAHSRGIPLIVDEAHGAHFGFHEAFPENATRLGADAVVMSVHKTLPAFTQTALLHLCSERLAEEEVARFLQIYETSSPSYVLMAGISRCVHMLAEPSARELFDAYARRLAAFREQMQGLAHLRVLGAEDFAPEEAFAFDPGKLILYTGDSGMSGNRLAEKLLEKYGLQMEMSAATYALAMTSVMDRPEGFARLAAALEELDAAAGGNASGTQTAAGENASGVQTAAGIYREQERCMEISAAVEAGRETVPFAAAENRISADYIYLYPPGIPILVPGERISRETLADLAECRRMGLQVEGIAEVDAIRVVKS